MPVVGCNHEKLSDNNFQALRDIMKNSGGLSPLTQTHGCLSAWSDVILFAGLIVNIWLMRFLASGVTVSHSGEGN